MGLDVYVHRNVTFDPQVADYDDPRYDEGQHVHLYAIDAFTRQADGMPGGVYRAARKYEHIARWSYHGYGRFREILCQVALGVAPEQVWHAADAFAGRPLVDLINFSDCEGFFGPQTSGRLADELDALRPKLVERMDRYDLEQLDGLRAGFRAAADTGGVVIWA